MAYLGVTHLAVRQAYILAGCAQHGVRAGGQQLVGERGVGEHGGIAGLLGSLRPLRVAAPTVANNQYYGFVCHGGILARFFSFVKPELRIAVA